MCAADWVTHFNICWCLSSLYLFHEGPSVFPVMQTVASQRVDTLGLAQLPVCHLFVHKGLQSKLLVFIIYIIHDLHLREEGRGKAQLFQYFYHQSKRKVCVCVYQTQVNCFSTDWWTLISSKSKLNLTKNCGSRLSSAGKSPDNSSNNTCGWQSETKLITWL